MTTRPCRRSRAATAAEDRYLEVVTRGTVRHTANVLRTASDESGGFISVRAQPAARVVRRRARRRRRDQLRARPRRGDPRRRARRARGAMIDVTAEHLGGSILTRRRGAPRRSCAPRTRSTSARSSSATSSSASSTSTSPPSRAASAWRPSPTCSRRSRCRPGGSSRSPTSRGRRGRRPARPQGERPARRRRRASPASTPRSRRCSASRSREYALAG